MFVSMPQFQLHVPAPLAAPGAFYARAMSLSSHAAWFVLTVRTAGPEPSIETFLLAWDSDVVSVLRTSPATLESLMFVAPQRSGRNAGWVSERIVEVWEATDPSDSSECVLMVTEDGQEHSGFFMEASNGIKRGQLVAKVPVSATKRSG
jgi:hypothetical protein